MRCPAGGVSDPSKARIKMQPAVALACVFTAAGTGVLATTLAADRVVSSLATCSFATSAPSWIRAYDQAGRALEAKGVEVARVAGPALATAIRISRWKARQDGTRPVPERVRTALSAYFPNTMFRQVRWVSLDRELRDVPVTEGCLGTPGAMTLGDTILFSSDEAAADLGLWAHELTHVAQYSRMGIDGFARAYSTNYPRLESEARAAGLQVAEQVYRERSLAFASRLAFPSNALPHPTFTLANR